MKNKLWYRSAAEAWEKGMALGNGRIGVMALGGAKTETLFLNEDTLWSGFPTDYADERVYDYLQPVRKSIFEKDYRKANTLINQHMVGTWTESYMPMAEVSFSLDNLTQNPAEYRRELDISTGVSTTTFQADGVNYERTVFCSHPDQVVVIRLKADRKIRGEMSIGLHSQLKHWVEHDKDEIILTGWCPSIVEPSYYPAKDPVVYEPFETTRAIKFQVRLKVNANDGEIMFKNGKLQINGSEEVVVTIAAGTSFSGYDKYPNADYELKSKKDSESASRKSYQQLLENHVQDFSKLFDRVQLDLGHTKNEKLPFDVRLQKLSEGEVDPELIATAFQFGRYLMISSSREGTQPTNLQGIWNNAVRPPWSSNYTVNINTEMNYWPVESCNLSECAEPLLRFIKEISETGEKTASVNYGCKGWVSHHNIDLWRKTTAVGSRNHDVDVLPWSFWPMSSGWLCRHLWEHYTFTMDKYFLRQTAYPIMKKAACFYLDWLVEYNGELVTNPSTAPENLFIDGGVFGVTYGSTMDIAIIKELFNYCIKASEVLCCDEEFRDNLSQALSRLPKFSVGKYGQLMEWHEDFEENDPKHRHLSHLYGSYPSDLITPENSPELAEACRVTLKRRGEGGVAWSRAWKINLWARLKDGEQALAEVLRFLQPASSNEISYTEGGVYYNLFSAQPLQIDGNFGFSAGIAEMIVQSHNGKEELLPALPKDWTNGYVKGLKVRGNKIVDIEWKDGLVVIADIH